MGCRRDWEVGAVNSVFHTQLMQSTEVVEEEKNRVETSEKKRRIRVETSACSSRTLGLRSVKWMNIGSIDKCLLREKRLLLYECWDLE